MNIKARYLGKYQGKRVHRWFVQAIVDGDLDRDGETLFSDWVAAYRFEDIADILAEVVFDQMTEDRDVRPFHIDSKGPKGGEKRRTYGWSGGGFPGGLEILGLTTGKRSYVGGVGLRHRGLELAVETRPTLETIFTN